MSTASLLVELQTEELPPKALKTLSEAFAAGIESVLRKDGFLSAQSQTQVFATPRRMAAMISNVAGRSPDQAFRQKLMPLAIALDANGQPAAALVKKLSALGVVVNSDTVQQLKRESDGKQEVLVYEGTRAGIALTDALQAAVDSSLSKLPIPKTMRYQLADGCSSVEFVRPAHRLLALHGTEVLCIQALGLTADRQTLGHRFHSSEPIVIKSADDYVPRLREHKVVASFDERRARIVELLKQAAIKCQATALMPDGLLDEVTALVEWPTVYESGFEKEFLQVPQECLILTMQQNQKYFALQDAQGQLIDRFLLVSNIETADASAITTGNARVVRARLADARFFYDQDRKEKLQSYVPGLASVVYHGKLGSQLQRVERITRIATDIASLLGVSTSQVSRAAQLAKADLRTLMVGEFPELQGLMGSYYARHDGEDDVVAQAIADHYRPRFAGDDLPASTVGLCLALADKLETLVGLFGVGERPSGDKDPFALRRHALGVLRMLIERKLPLSLAQLLTVSSASFKQVVAFVAPQVELETFFYDRLRGLLRDDGYSAHEVESVLALKPQRIDDITPRLAAVRAFMALPEAESLAAANKRIGNILKKSEVNVSTFNSAALSEAAEKALATAFTQLQSATDTQYQQGDYTAMLKSLAPLKQPVDRFFDEVMVNVDDSTLRNNRLALLAALRAQMNKVADLSLLVAS